MRSERDVGSKVKYEVTVSVPGMWSFMVPLRSWHRGETETCPKGWSSSTVWQLGGPASLRLPLAPGPRLWAGVCVEASTISWSSLTGHLNCCSGEAMRVREASLSEASAGGGRGVQAGPLADRIHLIC